MDIKQLKFLIALDEAVPGLTVQRIDPTQPVELRAFLQHQQHTVSETWTHLLLPE